MELRNAASKPHSKQMRLALAALACVFVFGAFSMLDVSGEAEPSRLETKFAHALLRMKIRSNHPMKLSPLASSEADPERASAVYEQRCSFCHGAARDRMAPFAESMSPRPPQFVVLAARGPTWMDAYIIRHGIRWTGMPAFSGLSEEDAWRIALYVEGQTNPKGKQ